MTGAQARVRARRAPRSGVLIASVSENAGHQVTDPTEFQAETRLICYTAACLPGIGYGVGCQHQIEIGIQSFKHDPGQHVRTLGTKPVETVC